MKKIEKLFFFMHGLPVFTNGIFIYFLHIAIEISRTDFLQGILRNEIYFMSTFKKNDTSKFLTYTFYKKNYRRFTLFHPQKRKNHVISIGEPKLRFQNISYSTKTFIVRMGGSKGGLVPVGIKSVL